MVGLSPLRTWQWVVLGLGFSTFSWGALALVVTWLFLGSRIALLTSIGIPFILAGTFWILSGTGDVLEPEHDVAAIGSGGNYALAAARAMMDSDKDAETVARDAMAIAADICVYTNGNLTVEKIGG